MPRCSLIRQMKGLHESFHLQYQRPSADNQSKIRYQSVTQSVPFFQKKVVTSDFFFFPEYWQQALDAASESRQSGLSFAASMTCNRSRRDPQDFFQKYSAMGHARFRWFCLRKWCDPLQHATASRWIIGRWSLILQMKARYKLTRWTIIPQLPRLFRQTLWYSIIAK